MQSLTLACIASTAVALQIIDSSNESLSGNATETQEEQENPCAEFEPDCEDPCMNIAHPCDQYLEGEDLNEWFTCFDLESEWTGWEDCYKGEEGQAYEQCWADAAEGELGDCWAKQYGEEVNEDPCSNAQDSEEYEECYNMYMQSLTPDESGSADATLIDDAGAAMEALIAETAGIAGEAPAETTPTDASASSTPATPPTETPAAPSTDTSAAPATDAPAGSTPAAPPTETPATPATETPAAPATDAPAGSTPATPSVEAPAAQQCTELTGGKFSFVHYEEHQLSHDSGDYLCDAYSQNPRWCATATVYDTADFQRDNCCACINRQAAFEAAEAAAAAVEPAPTTPPTTTLAAQQCTRLTGDKFSFIHYEEHQTTSDYYGYSCDGYSMTPSWCTTEVHYDTDDFERYNCCACIAQTSAAPAPVTPPTSEQCKVKTDAQLSFVTYEEHQLTADSGDFLCDAYSMNTDWCTINEPYNTANFNRANCCACIAQQ